MKKFLPFLSIVLLAVACNNKPAETRTLQAQQQNNADTTGLAQFQQWKAQNELSATAVEQQPEKPVTETPVKTVTVIREVHVPQRQATVYKEPKRNSAPATTSTSTPPSNPTPGTNSNTNNSGGTNDNSTVGTSSGDNTPAAETTPETTKKGGWSNAAKGATIGGAGGAVIGAVIYKKNPAVGGVIGGVLGGAVGYGIGKAKDKKENR